ncbi:uncharacterized protein LOC131667165 [Phymastichus coffea]|uniref:uncharacterized protein LOC131667165 n=1 Tax=Phymastichus coffea TaxID=108790 RepID=UPI00273CBEC7|nr:uncharacterized protein LOC131667165 [Phymastichus coffea]
MKTLFLVLALAVVVLASPADDKSSGDGHFNGILKFDFTGDSNFKGKVEALAKSVTDALKGIGFNGEFKSEGNSKSIGHLVGDFKYSGRRFGKTNSTSSSSTPADFYPYWQRN